jgi:hypothetical protein
VRDVDILARLTTLRWITGAELAAELAKYYRRSVAVVEVQGMAATLEVRGLITRRPRQEAGHQYGVAEYQLTEAGARARVRLSATDYDPFTG